jgi:hypothetical protein
MKQAGVSRSVLDSLFSDADMQPILDLLSITNVAQYSQRIQKIPHGLEIPDWNKKSIQLDSSLDEEDSGPTESRGHQAAKLSMYGILLLLFQEPPSGLSRP